MFFNFFLVNCDAAENLQTNVFKNLFLLSFNLVEGFLILWCIVAILLFINFKLTKPKPKSTGILIYCRFTPKNTSFYTKFSETKLSQSLSTFFKTDFSFFLFFKDIKVFYLLKDSNGNFNLYFYFFFLDRVDLSKTPINTELLKKKVLNVLNLIFPNTFYLLPVIKVEFFFNQEVTYDPFLDKRFPNLVKDYIPLKISRK